METEREVLLRLIQALDQTDRCSDMIRIMKKIIDLNPELTPDEQNILSMTYKNAIQNPRNGLRTISSIISNIQNSDDAKRVELEKIKQSITDELQNYCKELIDLIETKLLPAAKVPESQVFYEKLEADYYRYICEALENEAKDQPMAEAQKHYEKAQEIANQNIQPYKPSYLGLILNYTVFLYEVRKESQRAIELATSTYNERVATIDQNSTNENKQEAETILRLLDDNIQLWKKNEANA